MQGRGGSGGSSGTTGATRQPAGKQEVNGRGGVQKTNGRGGVSGQEVTVRREDERRRWHHVGRLDNQPEAPAEPPPPPPLRLLPPRRDGGAPHKIHSDGGGSDVSHIVHEFSIGEIHAAAAIVVNPLVTGADPRRTRGKRQAEAVAEVVNDPSDVSGSNVSRVICEFGIGEICASAVVVFDPRRCRPCQTRADTNPCT